ncbi:MAG: hypothetical protein LCH54_15660 [Bacteroidetes bacterium]|nr:hypothetical protein [Bacteroidota bacterium]
MTTTTSKIEILSSEIGKKANGYKFNYFTLRLNDTELKIYTGFVCGGHGVWLQGGGIYINFAGTPHVSKTVEMKSVEVELTSDEIEILEYAKANL